MLGRTRESLTENMAAELSDESNEEGFYNNNKETQVENKTLHKTKECCTRTELWIKPLSQQ